MGLARIKVSCLFVSLVEMRTFLVVIHYHNNLVVLIAGIANVMLIIIMIAITLFSQLVLTIVFFIIFFI